MRYMRRSFRLRGAALESWRRYGFATTGHDDPSFTSTEIIDIGAVPTGILDASGELIYRAPEAVGFEIPQKGKA